MSVHEQYAEDLALYALGALEGSERAALEKHLDDCNPCSRELERLRGDMALLALTAAGPKPPARSRERLMRAIALEPRVAAAAPSRNWWILLPSLAMLVLAAVAFSLWLRDHDLQGQISRLHREFEAKEAQIEQVRDIVATLTATDAQRITLVEAKSPPQPQGKAIYVRNRGSLIFIASNFRPLTAQKAYELWLIPKAGAPIPAGVFKPDAHGSATVINPPLPAGTEAKAFAITVEPESGSPAPTSTPIMLGAGE